MADEAYQEIKVRGDFSEYDRELARRQGQDPHATIGSKTFGTETNQRLLRSPAPSTSLLFVPPGFSGSNPQAGPNPSPAPTERLESSINRLAAVLEARAGVGGGLARQTGMTRGDGGGWGGGGGSGRRGGGGFSGDEVIDAEWSPVTPPPQIGGPQTGGAGWGGAWTASNWHGGGGGPGWAGFNNPPGTGWPPGWQQWGQAGQPGGAGTPGFGGGAGGPYGPNPHWWHNRWGPRFQNANAWVRRNVSHGMFYNTMFGAWEVQQARASLQEGELGYQIAGTDEEALQALGQGIAGASRGPMASVGTLAMDAIGFSNSPMAIQRMITGVRAGSAMMGQAQQQMQNLIVGRRQIGAMDLGGIGQKLEEAKLDRDVERAGNEKTLSDLRQQRQRIESSAGANGPDPEGFEMLDRISTRIKAQETQGPLIEEKYQARLRQVGREGRTYGISLAGRLATSLATVLGASPSQKTAINLQNLQMIEQSQAGGWEKIALAPVHFLERMALKREQDLETHDIGFDLATREERAKMQNRSEREEDIQRYEFSRKQQFDMELMRRDHPQNAAALQATQAAEKEAFEKYLDLPRLRAAESRAISVGAAVRSTDRDVAAIGIANPYLRRQQEIQNRYENESEQISRLPGLTISARQRLDDAAERRRDAELASAERDYSYYQKQQGVRFSTQEESTTALLRRDIIGSRAIEIAGAGREQAIRFREQGEEQFAQRALLGTAGQLQLLRRNYLEAFRGEQINLNEMSPTNARDVENPSQVLSEIADLMNQILDKIPNAD